MKIKCPDCSTSYEIKAEAVGAEGRSVKCAKCGNRWFVSPEDDEVGDVDFSAAADTADDDEPAVEDGTDKDEADWAADAEDDDTAPDAEDDSEPDDFKPEPPASRSSKDADKYAADLEDDEPEGSGTDIESSAKRPKIIVNPDKFRRNHVGALLNWLFRRNYRRIGGIALFGAAVAVCAIFILMRDNVVKQSPDLASLFQMIGFDVNLRGLEFRNLRTFTEVEDGKRVLVVEGSIRNLLQERNTVPAVRLSIRSGDMQEVYAWTVEPRTKSLNALDETRFRTILADPPANASDIQVRFVERGKRQIVLE
ncbi:zinc-ribbon domain-containing protein [Roseibium sediminicola]|uniref:Zinc-ribbon domain-containing protein n=1 Tax=Roseibium sediminicola TaxID=2933272 RepID=A0ABT0H006_9HYPH|nr:zinc-ribbon domain-containing protein [Roseibium sp. CAU 1639]MCK7614428.1 zinc-ribbon domain-containing protein [Roseibium sp. CAU 1639]